MCVQLYVGRRERLNPKLQLQRHQSGMPFGTQSVSFFINSFAFKNKIGVHFCRCQDSTWFSHYLTVQYAFLCLLAAHFLWKCGRELYNSRKQEFKIRATLLVLLFFAVFVLMLIWILCVHQAATFDRSLNDLRSFLTGLLALFTVGALFSYAVVCLRAVDGAKKMKVGKGNLTPFQFLFFLVSGISVGGGIGVSYITDRAAVGNAICLFTDITFGIYSIVAGKRLSTMLKHFEQAEAFRKKLVKANKRLGAGLLLYGTIFIVYSSFSAFHEVSYRTKVAGVLFQTAFTTIFFLLFFCYDTMLQFLLPPASKRVGDCISIRTKHSGSSPELMPDEPTAVSDMVTSA